MSEFGSAASRWAGPPDRLPPGERQLRQASRARGESPANQPRTVLTVASRRFPCHGGILGLIISKHDRLIHNFPLAFVDIIGRHYGHYE
jgi:hypothetical protein